MDGATLVARTRELTGLRTPHAAEAALEEVLSGIIRRIRPEEAWQLLAQVPSLLADRLASQVDGPDLHVSRAGMEQSIAYLLSVDAERAAQIVGQPRSAPSPGRALGASGAPRRRPGPATNVEWAPSRHWHTPCVRPNLSHSRSQHERDGKRDWS